jgi:ketosteroid isomerase-like protein
MPSPDGEVFSDAEYQKAREYIVAMSQDWASSVVTGDFNSCKAYFADDFQGTDMEGNRYDTVRLFSEGPLAGYVSNRVNQVDVRFFGKSAIAYGDETLTHEDKTQVTLVWTDIWIHRDGSWKLVAAQDVFKGAGWQPEAGTDSNSP